MRFYLAGFCAACSLLFGESMGSFERPRGRGNHIRFVGITTNSEIEENSKALLKAASDGNMDEVRSLMIRGSDVNFKDEKGITPLIAATENRHSNVVEYLLYCSAHVNTQKSENWFTPLMIACRNNDSTIVKSLLRFGADVNLRNASGFTAFHFAINNNNKDILIMLLTSCNGLDCLFETIQNENTKLLFYASKYGQKSIVDYCVESLGVDVNLKGGNGETPLIVACRNGYDDIVEYLLTHDAKINETMEGYLTALMFACIGGFQNIVKMLIERDANVNLVDEQSNSPLIFAVHNRHIEIANMLIEAGSNLNQKNKQEETPLSIATLNYELAEAEQRYEEQDQWKKIIELLKEPRSSNTPIKSLHR